MAENDLLITIDASTDGLRRGVSQAEKVVTQFGQRTEASLRQIDGTMKKVDGSFKVLDRGSTGFARFGGAAQQAGYQIGDFAVQVASGQNAVVALTQQLSQLLGAFGTAGAVIGAGAAIAGALATKLIDTRSASERFEDGLKRLADQLKISNNLLEETETGLTEVGDAFLRADEFGRRLIKSNLEESIRKQSQAIRDQAAAIKELTAEQELFSTISGPGGRPSTAIGILSPTDGLSKDQGFRISEAMRAFEQSDGGLRAAKEFAQALIDMRAELNGASPAFTAFADQLLSAVQESIKAGEATESLKEQLASLGREVPKNTAAVKEFEKASTAFAAAMDRLRTSAQGVIESYDPLAAAQSRAFEKLTILGDAAVAGAISWDEYAKATANVRAELKRAEDPLGTVLNGLKAELEMLKKSEDAREKATRVQAAYNEAVKNGAPAIEATRKAIEAEVDKILEQERANASAKKVRDEAAASAKKQADEEKALADRRIETIEDLQSEVRFLADLREAHLEGADAVRRVEEAREAELLVQRLKLGQDDIEVGLIDELIRKRGEHRAAIEAITDAQNEAERAARKLADEQKKAAEDAARAYEKVIDDIARNSQEKLGDAIFDHLKGETLDFGEFLKDTLLRAIADIAAAALTQQIVIPIAVQAVGAAPGLFGLSGQAAGVAQSAGGGLFGGGFNPLSSISNIGSLITGGPGSIATSIATSSLGGALGLSAPTGAVFGAEAGIALGGAASGTALTGAGTALVAAAPYLAAAAIALPILLGAFGRKPSVGPTGVARLPNVIGDSEIRLGTDNGGNADAAKAVAQSIRDISTSAADTLGAFGQRAFGLDIGNFSAPESGNSQPAGFNLKEIIDNVLARSDTFKGLTADEAITEGVRLTLQKGFDGFPVAEVSTALSNSAAKTIGDLLSDLDFANAYREMFLPVLDAAGPFETQMDALSDAFDEAKKRAEDLGLTTDGLAVNFAAANDNMKEAFRASLGAEAAGVGGQFGQIIALATQLDQLTTDAALAGVSAETLSTVIDQRLRATVEGLTSGEIQSLIGALSEVRGQVQGADLALSELAEAADIAAVAEGIAAAADLAASIEAENQRMYAALIGEQELRVEALEEEKRALEDVAAASGQAARALRAAAGGLLTDPNFSPLNGLERAQEASRQVEEAFALATDGTPFDAASQDAINRLPDLIRVDLEANRAYYASSEDYLARFNRDQQILNSLASSLESIEQQQLGHLASIDTRLAAAVTALENLRIVAGGGTVGAGGGAVTAPDAIGGGTITGSEFVDRQNAYLANNPDVVAGIAQGWFTSGYDHWIKAGQFEDRPDAFHTGGFPDPGSMFRALPSEIMVHAPSMGQLRVFDPMASAALRGGANDNGEVVSAVNRLSDKLDRLILLMADSGEASIGALGQVAEGLVEVRQAVKRSA